MSEYAELTSSKDNHAVQSLSEGIHALDLTVTRLEGVVNNLGGMISQQITGLVETNNRVGSLDNRITITESKIVYLERKNDEIKTESAAREREAQERQDRQIGANRWLIVTLIMLIGTFSAVFFALIRNVQLKP